jgi:hypothetical protein
MTNSETELLIKKYLNGETTADEERLLALEVFREDAPEDWKIIAGMLGELTIDEALFDQMMAERRQNPRIIKLWPWLAAACVAALLVIFLGPPRDDVSTQPQIAKVEPQNPQPVLKVQESDNVKEKPQATVTKKVAKALRKARKKQVAKPENNERALIKVEASDIIPYDDPYMQFAEQVRALRERGNRVIQRVSMNSVLLEKTQLNNI